MKKSIPMFLLSVLVLLVLPRSLFAAEMFFEQEKSPAPKDQFKMGVFLETEEALNAIEGTLRFPRDLLELKNVEDGNSIINFWLERPAAGKTGEIIFSGIIPGGYKGGKGFIFSMTFSVKQEGAGTLTVHDARVLRSDGEGTEARLRTFDSPFIVSKKTSRIEVPVSEIKDGDPPETFAPEIAKDKSVFENRWFLVFATQDKGSGIDHYEVKESRQRIFSLFQNWSPAESPHVLQDQEFRSFIFVKAVDKAGNKKIIKVEPRNPLSWYAQYENWIIIIAGLAVAYAVKKNLWKKRVQA